MSRQGTATMRGGGLIGVAVGWLDVLDDAPAAGELPLAAWLAVGLIVIITGLLVLLRTRSRLTPLMSEPPPVDADDSGELIVPATDAAQIDLFVTHLRRLQTEGGETNTVVFAIDRPQNHYVQVLGESGSPHFYLEASRHDITPAQRDRLETLGWTAAPENDFRTAAAHTDADRHAIAMLLLHTLREVYGYRDDERLTITLELA